MSKKVVGDREPVGSLRSSVQSRQSRVQGREAGMRDRKPVESRESGVGSLESRVQDREVVTGDK